ncbi:hypothetical protein FXO38_12461 [Capsicum annuum]|nr:hypothetical protein FXO37_19434 [Capsicum annuum]KAF3659770.1 hypothetical protein FXO38_12461 [Capsicum annuum]
MGWGEVEVLNLAFSLSLHPHGIHYNHHNQVLFVVTPMPRDTYTESQKARDEVSFTVKLHLSYICNYIIQIIGSNYADTAVVPIIPQRKVSSGAGRGQGDGVGRGKGGSGKSQCGSGREGKTGTVRG